MTISWRFLRTLIWLLLLTTVLTACTGQPERLWPQAPGWSRAQLMGNTRVGDPVPIAFDDEGQIYLFLISATDGVSHPRVVSLDRQANITWDRLYEEIEVKASRKPNILWDGEVLQLFWISENELYNTQVELTGTLLGSATLLSGGTTVDDYEAAYHVSGTLAVWYAGSSDEPGLYITSPDEPNAEAILVDAEGIWPDLVYDDAGTLHAIWAHYPPGGGDKPFFYAAYPNGVYTPGQETILVAPRIVGTTVLEAPQLGLDNQYAYVFWSMISYSGLEAGIAKAFYLSFPKGKPSIGQRGHRWYVPYSYKLAYQSFPDSGLLAGERVSLDPSFIGGSRHIIELEANTFAAPETVITFHARVGYLMQKQKSQIGAAFFHDGAPTAYQLLSFTPSDSTFPAVFSDDDLYLYGTWLEKGDLPGWGVYFASTAPDLKEALRDVSADDIARLSTETLFGLLSGALLIPVALIWSIPTIIVLLLTTRLRPEEERATSLGTIVSLIIAFAVYFVVKIGVLPGMVGYSPFSAWIPIIPSWLDLPLRIGVPILIAALAFLVASYVIHRREGWSIFLFVILFSIIDSVLTIAVYGVLIYAAF